MPEPEIQIRPGNAGRHVISVSWRGDGSPDLPVLDEIRLASARARARFLQGLPEMDRAPVEAVMLREAQTAASAPVGQPSTPLSDKIEPWPEPVEGPEVLLALIDLLRRFLVLPVGADWIFALWVMHAHAHDAAEHSPILAFVSPTPQCGKTTALNLAALVVPRPVSTANITPAAIYRIIERARPTLLIDEADSFMRPDSDLRNILNAGHSSDDPKAIRCHPTTNEPEAFSVWAPKALGLIGKLPATLADRSIIIRMRRKKSSESVDPFRARAIREECDELRRKLARWASDSLQTLRGAEPITPPDLSDRAADNARPLLAIAKLVAADVFDTASKVFEQMSRDGTQESEGQTQADLLLRDIRAVFEGRDVDRISSEDLVSSLVAMEERPWAEMNAGRPLSKNTLARRLAPFQIHPDSVRFGDATRKGYFLADFVDAFARWLPPEAHEPEHPEQASIDGADVPVLEPEQITSVPPPEQGDNQHECSSVPDVPLGTGGPGTAQEGEGASDE